MENAVSQRLKKFRKATGLTQQDVAQTLNVTTSAVGFIETGKSKIGIDHLTTLQEVYKLNSQWLLTGKGDMFIDEPQTENVSAIQELSAKLDRLIDLMVNASAKEGKYLEAINNLSKHWVSENTLSVAA